MSHNARVEQRTIRLSQSGKIKLYLASEEVRSLNDQRVELIFQKTYKSRRYQDKGSKSLLMEKRNGRWLIVQKEQLASLPLEQLSTALDFY